LIPIDYNEDFPEISEFFTQEVVGQIEGGELCYYEPEYKDVVRKLKNTNFITQLWKDTKIITKTERQMTGGYKKIAIDQDVFLSLLSIMRGAPYDHKTTE
jgi:hypothetical protein